MGDTEPRRCPQCGLPVAFTSDHFNGSAGWTCEPFGTQVPEPRPELTPREEFESVFGPIIDDQWQWLKEFVARQHVLRDLREGGAR